MSSIGIYSQLACLWEATARKPGNIHPAKSFLDMTYLDFVMSSAAIGPWMESASQRPVGETIRGAIEATRQVVSSNTNLGIVLLLSPLATVSSSQDLKKGLAQVIKGLTVADARQVYRAIRLSSPGGLGTVTKQDIKDEPEQKLSEVMALAADRDLVARQYWNGFREVFERGVPLLK